MMKTAKTMASQKAVLREPKMPKSDFSFIRSGFYVSSIDRKWISVVDTFLTAGLKLTRMVGIRTITHAFFVSR
ncbi:hypothetical protein SDC9_208590 [bioreactor metagenome]|uniref:Uncharacterized protein n=1 Tax=bioreactor metagenome TaxID=1076179 RepID=A0A645JC02_9ZZZZ